LLEDLVNSRLMANVQHDTTALEDAIYDAQDAGVGGLAFGKDIRSGMRRLLGFQPRGAERLGPS